MRVRREVWYVVGGGLVFFGPLLMAILARLTCGNPEIGNNSASLVYSWPLVTCACVVTLLVLQRESISEFLKGMRSVKAGGVEVERDVLQLPKVTPASTWDRRQAIKDWLDNQADEDREVFRQRLEESFGWEASEVLWIFSAPEEFLDQVINEFQIPRQGLNQ